MGAHWNTQNTSQYIAYCDVFCVFQWAPITILPSLFVGHFAYLPYAWEHSIESVGKWQMKGTMREFEKFVLFFLFFENLVVLV